jgi:hypothetical protein
LDPIVRWKAVKRHIAEEHPDTTPQKLKGECITAGKNGDAFWQAAHAAKRKAEQQNAADHVMKRMGKSGHKPVRLAYGTARDGWYCKACWRNLHGSKTKACPKKPECRTSSAEHWRLKRENGRANVLAKLLGKTVREMDEFYGYKA